MYNDLSTGSEWPKTLMVRNHDGGAKWTSRKPRILKRQYYEAD